MRRFVIPSLVAGLLLTAVAMATVVARVTVPEMVVNADRIAEGRVKTVEAYKTASGIIATRVTVAVDRAYRNVKAGETFAFSVPGGELGNTGLIIPGMPRFAVDEAMILFLTVETSAGIRVPVGLGQGKFRVEVDEKTGVKRLTRSIGAVELMDVKTGKSVAAPASEAFDYAAFTSEIEKLVSEDDARRAKKAAGEAPKKGGK